MAQARRSHGGARLLRDARRRHGLNQRALAKRAGTTQAEVSRIERGVVSPSLSTIDRLLAAMGEMVSLRALPLDQPPPGGGNVSIRELRADYERLTPEQRLEQAAELSRVQTALAAIPLKLEELLGVLFEHEIEFIVIGGFALAAHGHVRGNEDLDICPAPASANLRRLGAALDESFDGLSAGGNWRLRTRLGQLDVMQSLSGFDAGYPDLEPHAEERNFLGHRVRFCSYEDLVTMKEAAARDQDLIDVQNLRAARGEL